MMPLHPLNARPTTSHPNAAVRSSVHKVVVVNSSPEILALAERVLATQQYDIVIVESITHAYSRIRAVRPDLVVLCLRIADVEAFQLLSMLKIDPVTRNINVLTFTAEDFMAGPEYTFNDDAETSEALAQHVTSLMN